jgi:hypothetical protein
MDNIVVTVSYQQKGDAGPRGQDGLSAYQIAVENGFVGTEAEWLLSLQGSDSPGGGGESIPQDNTPTLNSTNNVKSGGIFNALEERVSKTTTINGKSLAGNISLDKVDIGLAEVNNTSDLNKPISTAQDAALLLKANKTYVDTQDAAIVTQLSGAVPVDANTLFKLNSKIAALQSLINGDDVNLDTIKELSDAIKADEGLLTVLGTNKLNISDIYNALDYALAGKALDARQGKALKDLIAANTASIGTNTTAITSNTNALATKADLVNNKVNPDQLNPVYFSGQFSGDGSTNKPLNYKNQILRALQFLGSPIKGQTVGFSPMLTAGSSGSMSAASYYGVMIEVPEEQTLTGVMYMLGVLGVYTANNENNIGLYTFDAGTLTKVAATANNPNLYAVTSPGAVSYQEPFVTPYLAKAGFYFLVFLYNSSAQTTAPALINYNWGSVGEKGGIKTTTGRIAFKSLTAGKTTLPASIAYADTNAVGTLPWGGVY